MVFTLNNTLNNNNNAINSAKNSAITIIPFDTFDELAEATLPKTQKGSVALSGGSTYDALFEAWSKVDGFGEEANFFGVDERVVPLSDPASNWGNACAKLFSPLGITGQCNNAATSVEDFTTLLSSFFESDTFVFDAVFLGVGDDGHTASLFPGDTEAMKSSAQVLATESPKGIKERITLGSSVLASAKELVMVIAGEAKAPCMQWLKDADRSYPFVEILAQRDSATLYLHRPLYELFINNK